MIFVEKEKELSLLAAEKLKKLDLNPYYKEEYSLYSVVNTPIH